jgi:heme A synthase
VLAILVGLGVAYLTVSLGAGGGDATQRLGRGLSWLILAQFAVGFVNVVLATPLETQVIHLAVANAIWVAYVLFAASLLGETSAVLEPRASRI